MIGAICNAFGNDDPASAGQIAKRQVLEWMASPDISVQGCIYRMVSECERARHIEPPLEFEDYFRFVIPYLMRCIRENPDSEWTETRYIAGHALVGWVGNFWKNSSVPRDRIGMIKASLADLYRSGDEGVRDAVINGVLEHLFEDQQLARYFNDWEADPVLGPAYRLAMLWPQGGTS